MNRHGDTSAFVNPAGQLLLTRRGKTRMDSVGIVIAFYTATVHRPWLPCPYIPSGGRQMGAPSTGDVICRLFGTICSDCTSLLDNPSADRQTDRQTYLHQIYQSQSVVSLVGSRGQYLETRRQRHTRPVRCLVGFERLDEPSEYSEIVQLVLD